MSKFVNGFVLSLIGVVLLSLLVWLVGPLITLGESTRPLDHWGERLLVVFVAFAIWGGYHFFKRFRIRRANEDLTEELGKSSAADAARTDAPGRALEHQFDEALAALKSANRSLYEMPWYVVIGPPGVGKTTLIKNAGLKFPLAQRFGDEAIRGVGGTRNCDWWFTDNAILLDTAGRYVTQDSDPQGDSQEWQQFLALLQRARKRRPVNGVLVALNAPDLMRQSAEERAQHVVAVRRRLEELNAAFKLRIPVYVILTKLDLLSGFKEYFDDFGAAEREQVWGTTGRWDEQRGSQDLLAGLDAEYDALVARINDRLIERLRSERDQVRKVRLAGFPREIAGLKSGVIELLTDIFGPSRFDAGMVLRGVYFTSGTQVGVPLDALIASLSSQLGIHESGDRAAAETGRSYFLTRLLTDVIFKEEGLVGKNRKLEIKLLAAKLGAYVGLGIVTVLIAIGWFISSGRNVDYLESMDAAIAEVRPELDRPVTLAYPSVLPRLDAVAALGERAAEHADDRPFLMGLGLFQGNAVTRSADDAYGRVLNGMLLPLVAAGLERRLVTDDTDIDGHYARFKTYLMLADPQHMQRAFARNVVTEEIRASTPGNVAALSEHAHAMIERDLVPIQPTESIVVKARAVLTAAEPAALVFADLRTRMQADHPGGLALAGALHTQEVFVRRGADYLDVEIPYLYTREGFMDVVTTEVAASAQRVRDERWVLGDSYVDALPSTVALANATVEYYERAYTRYWDQLLGELRFNLPARANRRELLEFLDAVQVNPSPLAELYEQIVQHTELTYDDAATAAMNLALGRNPANPGPDGPGSRVRRAFRPHHLLVPAGIERIRGALSDVYVELLDAGNSSGSVTSGLTSALRVSQLAAAQPPALRTWLNQIGGSGQAISFASIGDGLADDFKKSVARRCRDTVAGRYPFAESDDDLRLADFGTLFGVNGAIRSYRDDKLATYIEGSGRSLVWNDSGQRLGLASAFLAPFRTHEVVADAFFNDGGNRPAVRLLMRPEYLDVNVRQFVFTHGTRRYAYSHGDQNDWRVTWPPSEGPDFARVAFELADRSEVGVDARGPWALFRLFDQSQIRGNGDQHVTFQLGGHVATFRVDSESGSNPLLIKAQLPRLGCGAGS